MTLARLADCVQQSASCAEASTAACTSTRVFPDAHSWHCTISSDRCVIHAPLKTLNELSSMLHSHASDNSADANALDEGRPLRRPGR
jgi:hypothetical protein